MITKPVLKRFVFDYAAYSIPLFVFSLWDYYIIPVSGRIYGRIFDYCGIFLILFFISSKIYITKLPNLYVKRTAFFIWLFALLFFIPQMIFGILEGSVLTVFAFYLGLFLVLPYFLHFDYNYAHILRVINVLTIVNLLFFYIQFFAYKCFGVVIDYLGYFNAMSARIFNTATFYFRAAGLFQEPNSFCLMVFMLLVVRLFLKGNIFDLLSIIALVAIFLSESLWGFGAIVVLLILFTRSVIYKSLILALVIAFSFTIVYAPKYAAYLIDPITVGRIPNVLNEGSYLARYCGKSKIRCDFNFFFGHGLSTNKFQGFSGCNAIGFIIYSFGFFGFILFLFTLLGAFKKSRIKFLFAIIFAMTSYPLFTYMFWWTWLGIIIKLSRMNYYSENTNFALKSRTL